jgi:uncharacterized protein YidB (DUF937 family)
MGLLDSIMGSLSEGEAQGGSAGVPAALTGLLKNGGLSGLADQFNAAGLGHLFESWVGQGPNKSIAPHELHRALGQDQVNDIAAQTGMSQDRLLPMIAKYLPQIIDKLSSQGRLPDNTEL